MGQASLFPVEPKRVLSQKSLDALTSYQHWREQNGIAPVTLASEVSQLRSLARQAEAQGLTLVELKQRPQAAGPLIEDAGMLLGNSAVQTRVRAFVNFLMMGLSPYHGRQ